jgi:hypothetical protein
MQAAARARYRQRLKDLKAEILAEGDVALEPGRKDAADVGTDEDAQPLGEMSQAIASGRNKNRAAVLERVVAALKRIDDDPETFGLASTAKSRSRPSGSTFCPTSSSASNASRRRTDPRARPAAATCATFASLRLRLAS